jgi:hypothetical protein
MMLKIHLVPVNHLVHLLVLDLNFLQFMLPKVTVKENIQYITYILSSICISYMSMLFIVSDNKLVHLIENTF